MLMMPMTSVRRPSSSKRVRSFQFAAVRVNEGIERNERIPCGRNFPFIIRVSKQATFGLTSDPKDVTLGSDAYPKTCPGS